MAGNESTFSDDVVMVKLDYQPPYRFDDLLKFFRDRALEGVELIDEESYARTVRLAKPDGSVAEGWIRIRNESSHNRLALEMPDSLAPVIPDMIDRVRRMFDTDSNPEAISQELAPLKKVVSNAEVEGVRLPGCFDPFETACRAVIGQQISVRVANKIAARIARSLGTPIETDIEGLDRTWPTPSTILSLESVEDALGELGVIKTRSRVIHELASAFDEEEFDFDAESNAEEQIEKLLSIKGIGPWTANYIAMRVLSYPDAFLETDAGVAHALPDLNPRERLATVEPCRPRRSYANIALWNSLSE